MGFFSKPPEKSLSELEEEHETLKSRRAVMEEQLAIDQLREKLGSNGYKHFSSNGKRSGFNLDAALTWLKNH